MRLRVFDSSFGLRSTVLEVKLNYKTIFLRGHVETYVSVNRFGYQCYLVISSRTETTESPLIFDEYESDLSLTPCNI